MRAPLFDKPSGPAGRIMRFCKELRQRPEFAYPAAFALIGLATVVQWLAREQYAGAPFLTIYPAIIVATLVGGLGPGFVAAILAGLSQFDAFIPGLKPLALATYAFDATICVMLIVFINRTFDLLLANIELEKRAKQHQHVVAAELHHRIQNLFTVIQAVVRFSFPGNGVIAESDIRQRLMARLQSMSNANRVLTDSMGDGVRLVDLINGEIGCFAQQFKISGAEGILLDARMTQDFGLILHELVTNAIKYGALSVPPGRVAIEFDRLPSALRFAWLESGGPPVKAPAQKSFGSQILETFARGFCSNVAVRFAPGGVCYSLELQSDGLGASGLSAPADIAVNAIVSETARRSDAGVLLAWLPGEALAAERRSEAAE
ncbi:MAG TPA: HWE histidine kinase domain-containing protein [Xanthobacteraceae bacterium]|jgi:two-component sensor histidine kinase|nr:HWE histidine kinase domain-containing protein [Xanthobacteraceae bacterium]